MQSPIYIRKLRSKQNKFCQRYVCCGIRLENGCLIFAILNAIVVGSFLGECLYFIVWLLEIQFVFKKYKHEETKEYFSNLIYGFVLTVCAGICFFFAIVLCYGILRKKPSYIKAYFAFGVVVEILGVYSTLAFIAQGNLDNDQQIASHVALAICGVYPFLLILVKRTYGKMLREAQETGDSYQKLITRYNYSD